MQLQILAAVILAVSFSPPPIEANGGWNDPTSDQFHIQTDEGPERYFKYQTQNGQYRKEKRLEDGTVVGSYGWIDSDGFLRLRDYIADNAGYRILRSKNVFVGRNRPIAQAVKVAKKVPSSAGVLTKTDNTYLPPKVTYLPSVSSYTPQVDVSPNSYGYTTTEKPLLSAPSSTIAPPYSTSTALPPSTTDRAYISSTTPAPETVYIPAKAFSTPVYISSTPSNYLPPQEYSVPTTISPPINSNSIDYSPQYEHYDQRHQNPYLYHNGPTYPIDRNGNTYHGYNAIGNGYDPQYPQYDGVSVTNDGFRYYIPRAYHEEQNAGESKKSGSFGYIDPFGIRRVIYYNAGPDGFQHRKNNRYVGFSATPYDPRPY